MKKSDSFEKYNNLNKFETHLIMVIHAHADSSRVFEVKHVVGVGLKRVTVFFFIDSFQISPVRQAS